MDRADYLYIVSYPTYSGYRVEHDPVMTVYYSPLTTQAIGPNLIWLAAIVLLAVSIATTAIILRKKL